MTSRAGAGARGGGRNGGEDGEMCRHSVAPLAWERGSHEIEKLAPGGRKRSPRGVKFRPPGGPKTADLTRGPVLNPWFVASGGLPGRLGRQVRLRRAV